MSDVNPNMIVGPIRHLAFEAAAEVLAATEKFAKFNSAHEGFAVLADPKQKKESD